MICTAGALDIAAEVDEFDGCSVGSVGVGMLVTFGADVVVWNCLERSCPSKGWNQTW